MLVNNPLAVFKIRITGTTAVVQHNNPYLWAAKPVRIKIEKVKKKEFVRFGLNPTTYYWISGYCDKGIEYPYTDIGQRSYRTNVTFRVRV